MVGVVAARDGDIEQLLVGCAPALAALALDEIEQFFLFIEHEIVIPIDDSCALVERAVGPGRLCVGGAFGGRTHVRRGVGRHRAEFVAGVGRFDGDRLAIPWITRKLAEQVGELARRSPCRGLCHTPFRGGARV